MTYLHNLHRDPLPRTGSQPMRIVVTRTEFLLSPEDLTWGRELVTAILQGARLEDDDGLSLQLLDQPPRPSAPLPFSQQAALPPGYPAAQAALPPSPNPGPNPSPYQEERRPDPRPAKFALGIGAWLCISAIFCTFTIGAFLLMAVRQPIPPIQIESTPSQEEPTDAS